MVKGLPQMSNPYYQDELVTLYHGDCLWGHREWLDADILVTDPPYGIGWTQKKGVYRGAGSQTYIANSISGDRTTEARDAVLEDWAPKPAIVFGSWRKPRPLNTEHRLIWHKFGQQPGPANSAFMSQDEEIYVIGKGWRKSSPPLRSVIRTDETRHHAVMQAGHPTPKPIPLMETLIDRCPEGVLADPFAGSGSTLVAAKNLGRKVIGVELEERYCEIIAKRCAQEVFDFGGAA
jgi:site-specific DNA-methyltransferase (adenine-specific)